jgi:undecaprenyl diphosphate synthase
VAIPEAGVPPARPTDALPIAQPSAPSQGSWSEATGEGATGTAEGPTTTAQGPTTTAQVPTTTAQVPTAGTESDSRSELPGHVAIIMDGNRRWARERGLPELEGHAAGVEAIRNVLRHAVRRGVAYLTLYAFSRENWARSDEEVSGLFGLLESAMTKEADELREQGVRVRVLGRLGELPPDTRSSIEVALAETARNARLTLNIAFNYAGRTELVDAFRRLASSGVAADDIDEAAISGALYTSGQPDPDLVIRTGGEQRLSNFLIWQSAYAELYTCDVLWPDFGPDTFDAALLEFARRTRRFGR